MADSRLAGPVGDRVVDMVGHEDGAHRHVAGGQPLGRGHEVGDDVVVLAGEERAGAAEAGDDLVGNEQDVVLLANGVHGLQPPRRRHENASRPLDGLGIEGGNAVSAQFRDLRPQGGDRRVDDRLRVGAGRIAIGIVRRNLVLPIVGHSETGVKDPYRGKSGSRRRGPMVAIFDRDELVLLRCRLGVIVVADEPDRAVDGVGAAEREVDMVEVARRQFGQPGGQTNGRLGAQPEIARRIGKLAQLLRCSLDDAVLSIAGVDAPQTGKPVEQSVSGGIGRPIAPLADFSTRTPIASWLR